MEREQYTVIFSLAAGGRCTKRRRASGRLLGLRSAQPPALCPRPLPALSLPAHAPGTPSSDLLAGAADSAPRTCASCVGCALVHATPHSSALAHSNQLICCPTVLAYRRSRRFSEHGALNRSSIDCNGRSTGPRTTLAGQKCGFGARTKAGLGLPEASVSWLRFAMPALLDTQGPTLLCAWVSPTSPPPSRCIGAAQAAHSAHAAHASHVTHARTHAAHAAHAAHVHAALRGHTRARTREPPFRVCVRRRRRTPRRRATGCRDRRRRSGCRDCRRGLEALARARLELLSCCCRVVLVSCCPMSV